MIQQINISQQDKNELSNLQIDPASIKDDFYDYSKVVVKKPWGYEYLIFANEIIAVWILYLKPGAQTSMHCHPNKKTSLVVLEGKVHCSMLTQKNDCAAGEGLLIDKGVFHQTTTLSENGAFVMEIETPVNKRDLARLKDRYGREGMGYETEDQHSFNTQNYNYISFNNLDIQHNLKKRFGQCSMTFKKLADEKGLRELFKHHSEDVICLLRGQLSSPDRPSVIQVGDTMTISLKEIGKLTITQPVELLIIKKIDHVIKVSDYIASFLAQRHLNPVFAVPGEANVHLLDSIGRHEGSSLICTQIEKSASLAVEAFAKVRSDLGVLVVSSGAATANSLPGVANAWVDSTPILILSGQARTDQDADGCVRQLGNKSLNIVDLIRPITKYAVRVVEPLSIRYHLEKAICLAREGRPGPVWIDLPIDIQGMQIDADELKGFDPSELKSNRRECTPQVQQLFELLKKASRPVLLAGSGVRNARAEDDLIKLIEVLKIPALTSRRGADLVPDDHPFFFGRPGTYGQRSANFIIQNCDLLISIGSRLAIPLIGRNTAAFARAARKVVVDIDPRELQKPTIHADLAIESDAGDFIKACLSQSIKNIPRYATWLERCRGWRTKFPPNSYSGPSLLFRDPEEKGPIYPLPLLRTLAEALGKNELVVADGGPPLIYTLLGFRFKSGQRLISSTGLELPGFAVAGAIGASVARNRGQIVCLCEDRGFQISIHELQTILDNRLPIKVLMLKSKGHSIIRNVQRDYFGGRFVGTDNELRLGVAPLLQIAKVFGFPTFEVTQNEQLPAVLREWLQITGPAVCEVLVEDDQDKLPRPGFTIRDDKKWVAKPLEDMYPLLDREVLKQNMLIDLVQED